MIRDPRETRNARELIVAFILGMVVMGLLVMTGKAQAAEYFTGEPKATSYRFVVPSQCSQAVKDAFVVAAGRFSTFVPVEAVDGAIRGVVYDEVDAVTCGTFPPALKIGDGCWKEFGLMACEFYVKSQTSNAVIGRATTWWAEHDATKLLECDIQIDPGSEHLLNTVMHEIAHCAGLNHNYMYREALMYPTLTSRQKGFHYDDIIGLCHLYGCEADILDDFNNLVVQRAVRPGVEGVWRGVLSGGSAVLVERVITPSRTAPLGNSESQ